MSPFDMLAARLAARAAALAEARAQRRRGGDWWRRARLLWPLFTKG
ncbi:MAG: hypothetical protein QM676_11545 [Novosphingobium sp.]